MATTPATYDFVDDFDVDGDLSSNLSLQTSSTGSPTTGFWNGNFTEVTVDGGRIVSFVSFANFGFSLVQDDTGFTSRTVVGKAVEAEYGTPASNFVLLRIGAFDEDFSNEISPMIQLNSTGSVFFGNYNDLQTMSPPPAPAASHVLKIVVTDGINAAYYVDDVLAGTTSSPGVQWTLNLLMGVRSSSYFANFRYQGNDILESSAPPAPSPPFWTGFVNSYEVGSAAAAPPPPDPEPGDPGESHTNPIDIPTPFGPAPLPTLDGTPLWLRFTVTDGDWKFSTATSPDPAIFDTYLALFDSLGNVVATNEDIDSGGGDYRSEIIETLVAGTYFLVLSTFGASADDGWVVVGGTADVPEGAVLVIETV